MKTQITAKRKAKTVRIISAIMLVLFSLLYLVSCGDTPSQILTQAPRTLDTPSGLRIEEGELWWNPVEHASRYIVSANGKEYYCDDYSYSIAGVPDGDYTFRVKAVGDGILYASSGFSSNYDVNLYGGAPATSGYYSQFDELTKNESFLGYGFDVIRSSVFSDKYVKTSFPLFKPEELMKQRLLKVDSKYVYIDEIQSEDMDEFMSDWNVNANVNVSWGKKKVGGSVGVEAAYSGGTESTRSKYFHCLSFNNQEFYIVMQSDLQTLRSIMTDNLKGDLYSDMEPSVLFDRYGTHFITSAVMGGKINSYYLYTSDEEVDFHDISAAVSTEVRYWAGKTDVTVTGGYRQMAESKRVDVKNTLEVFGGGNFGMMSDADISAHYADWEKSLQNEASLMGIKDTSSLLPIWELLDPSLDTRVFSWDYDGDGIYEEGNRSQQLQAYFLAYGVDSYNSLMEEAALPALVAPEAITDVRVNNQSANGNNEYEVFAGIPNDITFTVEPADAVGYKKTISLAQNSEYASINAQNQLVLNSDIPHNTTLTLVLSAGTVKTQIRVRVVKTYTVEFESNVDDILIDSYYNVKHGRQIAEPIVPERPDYTLVGWYTSYNFEEESKYVFGSTAIESDITLYAKWERFYPTVSFESNVVGGAPESVIVMYNSTVGKLAIPQLTGYIFEGWYEDYHLIARVDTETKITRDIRLYIKWIPREYTVTFDSAGGTPVPAQTISFGEKARMPENITKTGYNLVGWYTSENILFNFSSDTVQGNLNLYAKWTEQEQITISFDSQGGTEFDARNIYINSSLGDSLPVPTREGGKFVAWYTNPQYTNDSKVYPTTKFSSNSTLYAKWDMFTYTIDFNPNTPAHATAPTVSMASLPSIAFNTKVQLSDNTFTIPGWEFKGWSTSPNGNVVYGNKEKVQNLTSEDDATVTLYAVWSVDPLTVSKHVKNPLSGQTNGRPFEYYTVSDTTGENVYTVYIGVENTPWSPDERTIIDWSSSNANIEAASKNRPLPNWAAEANRWDSMDIYANDKELYLIGDPSKIYSTFTIAICQFEENQEYVLHLVDFNYKGYNHCLYGSNSDELNLTIDVIGNSSLGSVKNDTPSILDFSNANITITGNGSLNVKGSDGTNATATGASGSNGGVGITANDLIVNMTGCLTVTGGNGGNGAKGKDQALTAASSSAPSKQTTNGGNGGNGGASVKCSTLSISSNTNVVFIGGNGGNGGDGGDVTTEGSYNDYAQLPAGANGGNGGNGGAPVITNAAILISQTANLQLAYGNGGNGGVGGDGGDAWWNENGVKPDTGGNGGNGGDGGDGYIGGKGGDGGQGGYSFANQGGFLVLSWQYGQCGSGGAGGDGGDSFATISYNNSSTTTKGTVGTKGFGGAEGERHYKDGHSDRLPYAGTIGSDGDNGVHKTQTITIKLWNN